MPRSDINIKLHPVADHYRNARDEKIIEFSSPAGGGLIGFRIMDDGTLNVLVHRTDSTVTVTTGVDVRVRS